MKYKVFVSGNQKELTNERLAVKAIVTGHQTLRRFFDIFIFEDVPAKGKPASAIYLKEVYNSDIYLGILGFNYGQKQKDGLSETEREYRKFVNAKNKERKENALIFVKGNNKQDRKRDKEMQQFLKSIKQPHTYERFSDKKDFEIKVRDALLAYLDDKGDIPEGAFDEIICKSASYKDINEQEARDFLKNRAVKLEVAIPKISIKGFLVKTLRVVKKANEKFIPTNAALLFFGKNPSVCIPQNEIRIARFKGTDRLESIDSQEIKGPIYKILEQAEIFFKRNTRLANKIVEFKRVDIPEYPYEAIREAIINAIAHRDYFRSGAPIMISMFDDRVEISSPGGLLPGLNIRRLEGHHESRNKKICEIFHETKDMEKFGTGISRMKKLMKEHGLPEPKFLEEGDFFVVKFYGPGDKILDLVPNIPAERQTDLKKLGLNERQIEVLRLMINEKKTIEIADYCKLFKVNEKTARRDFKKLIGVGFISKIGATKGAFFKAK